MRRKWNVLLCQSCFVFLLQQSCFCLFSKTRPAIWHECRCFSVSKMREKPNFDLSRLKLPDREAALLIALLHYCLCGEMKRINFHFILGFEIADCVSESFVLIFLWQRREGLFSEFTMERISLRRSLLWQHLLEVLPNMTRREGYLLFDLAIIT